MSREEKATAARRGREHSVMAVVLFVTYFIAPPAIWMVGRFLGEW
jgi:hypothetical protein